MSTVYPYTQCQYCYEHLFDKWMNSYCSECKSRFCNSECKEFHLIYCFYCGNPNCPKIIKNKKCKDCGQRLV